MYHLCSSSGKFALESSIASEAAAAKLMKWKTAEGLHTDPSYNVVFGHSDFRVVLVTKFSEEDYREFLKDELPFELLQPIKVSVD